MLTKNKIKEKKYKGISSYPEVLGLTEATHSALYAFIYIFSNDGLHFKAEIVDPQKLWPNWLLCCDIENYVAT